MRPDRSCGRANTDLGEYAIPDRPGTSLSLICLSLLRNRVPWAILIACNGVVAILCLLIRFYLARENRVRARQTSSDVANSYEDVYIVVQDENGAEVKRKVDKAFLDLTDRQNLEYRYVL